MSERNDPWNTPGMEPMMAFYALAVAALSVTLVLAALSGVVDVVAEVLPQWWGQALFSSPWILV